MTLTRRVPHRSTVPLRDVIDWAFQDPWASLFDGGDRFTAAMPVDMRETGDAFVVEAELPGIKPEDTEVTIDGRTLVIRGRYSEERQEPEKGEHYLMRERRFGEVARSIMLPTAIDPDKVTSSFEHGELKVTLPKAAESRARKIPIGAPSGVKQVGSSSGTKPVGSSR
jgi:HSP20 family protein